MTQLKFFIGKTGDRFVALRRCLVPRSQKFDSEQERLSLEIVDNILSKQPAGIQRQFALFLFVIDVVSFGLGFRSFAKLSAKKQNLVMNLFFDSPVGLLRKGFWGLNTLAKMSVYGQSSLYGEIKYQLKETPHERPASRI